MKRLLALLLGGFGAGAWVLRRRRAAPAHETSPADELRARLAETKAEPESQPEPAAAEPEPDLDARRRAVHDRARARLDELA